MAANPTPRQILEAMLPHLQVAAAYAHQIQTRIAAHPEKENSASLFAAALSDADLSIQTFVEVALLGLFPQVRFFGEEHEKTYNTKYFRAIELGPPGDYLVTLDPIDGTRYYLDGHPNYQIILGVLNTDEFEAVLAINPALNSYYYALRGEGTFYGHLDDALTNCQPLSIQPRNATIFLGTRMGYLADRLPSTYSLVDVLADYTADNPIPNVNGILSGDLAGVILAGGKWIDGAALAFLAQEAGCLVTTHDGSPLPPLHAVANYQRPGLVIAASEAVHQDLLHMLKQG